MRITVDYGGLHNLAVVVLSGGQEHTVQRLVVSCVVKTSGDFSPVVGRIIDAEMTGRKFDLEINGLIETELSGILFELGFVEI